jgi:hypothetical protein
MEKRTRKVRCVGRKMVIAVNAKMCINTLSGRIGFVVVIVVVGG